MRCDNPLVVRNSRWSTSILETRTSRLRTCLDNINITAMILHSRAKSSAPRESDADALAPLLSSAAPDEDHQSGTTPQKKTAAIKLYPRAIYHLSRLFSHASLERLPANSECRDHEQCRPSGCAIHKSASSVHCQLNRLSLHHSYAIDLLISRLIAKKETRQQVFEGLIIAGLSSAAAVSIFAIAPQAQIDTKHVSQSSATSTSMENRFFQNLASSRLNSSAFYACKRHPATILPQCDRPRTLSSQRQDWRLQHKTPQSAKPTVLPYRRL
ncbi:hypothetical protein BST61_g11467 [Cercospora zeina]